jgi:hypothetical protein
MNEIAKQPATPTWALVVTHMLNPNLVQGFPMFLETRHAVLDMVERCLKESRSVPIEDGFGEIAINLVLGGGMSFQVEAWGPFSQRMADMRVQQEAQMKAQQEASAAARFGVAPGGPRRIK